MTASVPGEPDPRTAPDDVDDAALTEGINRGESAQEPAEGADDEPAGTDGSPAAI